MDVLVEEGILVEEDVLVEEGVLVEECVLVVDGVLVGGGLLEDVVFNLGSKLSTILPSSIFMTTTLFPTVRLSFQSLHNNDKYEHIYHFYYYYYYYYVLTSLGKQTRSTFLPALKSL